MSDSMCIVKKKKKAMIVAGGTGGHIFPGLAVAKGLHENGWDVVWLGTSKGMESTIIPKNRLRFENIQFSGLRGKGIKAWLVLPFRLSKAFYQSAKIIYKVKPDILLCFGGYVTFPAGIVGRLLGIPLLLHEQNSIAGLSNSTLALVATRVYTAFPGVISHAQWIGNPLRLEFSHQMEPKNRFKNRFGPLKILVLGGSLGANFLNKIIPLTINLLSKENRPYVIHQSGSDQFEELQENYNKLHITAELKPFIENTAIALAEADLVICRSGASTVTEIAAIGVAAIFVPLPSAVDDHQTKNAMYLIQNGAGWLQDQENLSPQKLADLLATMDRSTLQLTAIKAKEMHKQGALETLLDACEDLTK
jgi:UDP-N-acetylglucosamine--N-acetylmuramyl-(pentapeptide) pyrophosphoryl-undecaprenol N-acetylglucosamine transferase